MKMTMVVRKEIVPKLTHSPPGEHALLVGRSTWQRVPSQHDLLTGIAIGNDTATDR